MKNMALLDFFKKPKKEKKPVPPRGAAKRTRKEKSVKPKREDAQKDETKRKDERAPVVLKESKTAWRVLAKPHVTEKSAALTVFNQYVFRVIGNPSKPEVKRAIEEIYDVHVTHVRKITVPRKERRRGKHIGWRSGYKKAIVKLREGEKIEVLPH